MVLEFLGNCPKQKYFRVGIMANNLVDDVVFLLDNRQGAIKLSDFTPFIKMCNKDLSFVDKTQDFDVEVTAADKVKFTYRLPDKVTRHKNVDMQLSFEKHTPDGDTAVWQTQMFNLTFDDYIDVSKTISEDYPDALQDFDRRITQIEESMPTVEQYECMAYFPNIGVENAVYIDAAENKAYRYDVGANYYYVVGSDYEDIKTINANGGTQNGKQNT